MAERITFHAAVYLILEESNKVLRSSLDQLHTLEPRRAHYLDALAFVLMRVARADSVVREEETRCMERILTEYSDLPVDQAMLVTEIARHRLDMADAGRSYEISRDLRHTLDMYTQTRVLDFLRKVALADGDICSTEGEAISQIAWELGIDPHEKPRTHPKIDA